MISPHDNSAGEMDAPVAHGLAAAALERGRRTVGSGAGSVSAGLKAPAGVEAGPGAAVSNGGRSTGDRVAVEVITDRETGAIEAVCVDAGGMLPSRQMILTALRLLRPSTSARLQFTKYLGTGVWACTDEFARHHLEQRAPIPRGIPLFFFAR